MKTSKIIFFSLLGAFAFFILAYATYFRLHGEKKSLGSDIILKTIKKDIPSFKVLILNDCFNVSLIQNDSTCIVVSSMRDSIAPQLNFTTREDTLWLSDFNREISVNKMISVHFSNTLKSVLLIKSHIMITNFSLEVLSLDLNLDESRVYFNLNKKSVIRDLNVTAKNHSYINANNFNVDEIGISLQNSEANLDINTKKMSGCLSDSSKINARQPAEIWLKKDSTSNIKINAKIIN